MKLADINLGNIKIPTVGSPAFDINNPDLTLGDILNQLIPYIFVVAGLVLLIYFIFGGYSLMTSAGDPKAIQEAKGKLTNALVGFIIIFLAYWLVQIVGKILGVGSFGGIF